MVFSADRTVGEADVPVPAHAGGVLHAFLYPDGPGTSTLIVETSARTLAAPGSKARAPEERCSLAPRCSAPRSGRPRDHAAKRGVADVRRRAQWGLDERQRGAAWCRRLQRASLGRARRAVGLRGRGGAGDADRGWGHIDEALARFEAARRPRAESLQRASAASQTWFEHVDRYIDMALPQFAYSCLTRSHAAQSREHARPRPGSQPKPSRR